MNVSMRALVFVALVLLGLSAWLLWPRTPPGDEERIREIVGEMATAAGERDLGGIFEHVSERYEGEAGSKRDLKAYLAGYLLRSDAVAAQESDVLVQVKGDEAQVSMDVLLARVPGKIEVSGEGLLGRHHIEATFAREDGTWRVVTARRRP